jgi:hypothetical protein
MKATNLLKRIKEQIKEIEHTWIYNDIAVGFEGENDDGNLEFNPDNEMTELFSKKLAILVKLADKL